MHCETDKIITASVPDPPFNARGGVPQTRLLLDNPDFEHAALVADGAVQTAVKPSWR